MARENFDLRPFSTPDVDSLATEHAAVSKWVEEAVASLAEHAYYVQVELKSMPSGQRLHDAEPDQARRYLLAAIVQLQHWVGEAERVRAQASNEIERMNAHHLPGWNQVWGRQRQLGTVVKTLMRRNLPLEKQDLIAILSWCGASDRVSMYHIPLGAIARTLTRYSADHPIDDELRPFMMRFASQLRTSHDKDAKRLGTAVEQLIAKDVESSPAASDSAETPLPPPSAAPAGDQAVLDQLKQHLGLRAANRQAAVSEIGPDQFQLNTDSPVKSVHDQLSRFFEEVAGTRSYYVPDLSASKQGRVLLALDPPAMGLAILAAAERHVAALLTTSNDYMNHQLWQSRYAAAAVVPQLMKEEFQLSRDHIFDLLLYLAVRPITEQAAVPRAQLRAQVEREASNPQSPLTEGERYVLHLLRMSMISGPSLGSPAAEIIQLTKLIGDHHQFYLVPGEVWADQLNDDIARAPESRRQQWVVLLKHLLTATTTKPSERWLKTAKGLVAQIGLAEFEESVARWLSSVPRGSTIRRLGSYSGDVRGAAVGVIIEENAICLRGILWTVPSLGKQNDFARLVGSVAASSYKKVPGVGPRAVRVGNACIYALSQIISEAAVGQLALLKIKVRFGGAQKEIEKAFNAAAERLNVPRDQIEEMGVPSYGLEDVGLHSETFGDYRAELVVTGSDAELRWSDAKGKAIKSVPAKVKKDHKDDLKELQQSLKDIQAMLPAQRDRIDSMFLLQKSWPVERWRERYLDHPLVGTIARRMIWCVDATPAMFIDGKATTVEGKPLQHGATAEITLWHPVSRGIDEISAWRRHLEELGITQPFKQAHREVYLLTDAERRTNTYSNRFAAHIIRQHQFNALCAARGWKNKLRLMVDDSYPPATRQLPLWGLRAEFWIEGIGQDYGTDTNESGVFLRLATDQVRFYRTDAAQSYAHAGGGPYASAAAGPGTGNVNEPLPLDQIPPLVLSEILRDVDLFVGVASVGNDPTWQDGGPEGRYQTYWQNYSFGELGESAKTRKQVLERLMPRLKIADRCSFSDKFLVVRGDKRTYKIHLGSGNILMEPNDQYLCIVPDQSARAKQNDLYLPFEGDNTLSIIISKAFLLAADTKIDDPTITRQIGR